MIPIKKKLINLTLALIFTWLVVSIYFYGQNYIVIKEYPIHVKFDTDNALVIVKNVSAYNYKPSASYRALYENFELPWFYNVASKIKNRKLQLTFINICRFYSRPYEFDKDRITINLEGIIAFKNLNHNNYDSIHERNPFDIDIYGDYDIGLTSGFGTTHEDTNILMFNSHGEDVLLKNNHTYKIIIKDRKTGKIIKEVPFRPEWRVRTYNYFQRKPNHYNFRPAYTVENFINLIKNNKKEAAASYIYFKRKDVFPWENLNHEYLKLARTNTEYYVGNYLIYKNVFAIDLLYFDPEKHSWKPGEEFAKQTVYYVDQFGKWKIIDVTPLKGASKTISPAPESKKIA